MAQMKLLLTLLLNSGALAGIALSAVLMAALPFAGQSGSAHARAASVDKADAQAKAKKGKKPKSAKTASQRKKSKQSKQSAKAKKPKANKLSAKKKAAKKKASNKRQAKKRIAKKRDANKRKTAKRSTKRPGKATVRKASYKNAGSKKASRNKTTKTKRSKVSRTKTRKAKSPRKKKVKRYVAARPTLGTVFRLQQAHDPLSLRSSVAYVFDPDSRRVLFSKNSGVVLPIASITKLMTAIIVLDAGQSMREMLTITRADIDRLRGSSSRLAIGTRLSRAEMLQLALMSSANRAANALGRHYPGGLKAFVSAMNAKARMFGMTDTQFADPTGLSGSNVSSAKDIARLAGMANDYPVIRQYSTADGLRVDTGYKRLMFHNTNRLIANDTWLIGLQKTGYIAEAGRCLVMVARIDGRNLVMVLLDSSGNSSRFADAQRIRRWLLKDGPGVYAASEPAALN